MGLVSYQDGYTHQSPTIEYVINCCDSWAKILVFSILSNGAGRGGRETTFYAQLGKR
jgi:hypothetical protein